MKRRKTFHLLVAILSTLAVLISLVPPALAGDTPTWGVDMTRDRRVNSSSPMYQGFALYNPDAKYYSLVPGLESYSTPTDYTVSGTNVVLAFAFEGQNGYLYGMQEKNNAITGLWGGPVAFPTDSVQDAASVSGPTTAYGYTSIGVGRLLYAWPNQYISGQVDAASIPSSVHFQIDGNMGNSDYQVCMNPAITAPVTWTGLDSNGNLVQPWQSPAAVVGSWDGGVLSEPVNKPAGVTPLLVYYTSTETDTSSTNANITSSPAYIQGGFAGIGTNGDGAVVFGVSGITDPWLVAMDPATGQYKTFGGGPGKKQVLAAGISSSPVWSGNHLYVPDNAGDLYVFNPDGSLLKAAYVGGKTASDISNIALGGSFVYAIEDNLTRMYVYDRAGSGTPLKQEGSWAPGNGALMYSPSLVFNQHAGYSNIYIGTNSGHVISLAFEALPSIITSDGSGLFNSGGAFFGAPFTGSPLATFGSVLADAGADHLLAAWTNDAGQAGTGGIEYWAPGTYSVNAAFDKTNVDPGEMVTLTAEPSPPGITYSGDPLQDNQEVLPGQGDWEPGVWANNVGAFGGSALPSLLMKHIGTGKWSLTLNAPQQPGTYTVNVQAISASGAVANATAMLTVLKNTAPPGVDTAGLNLYDFPTTEAIARVVASKSGTFQWVDPEDGSGNSLWLPVAPSYLPSILPDPGNPFDPNNPVIPSALPSNETSPMKTQGKVAHGMMGDVVQAVLIAPAAKASFTPDGLKQLLNEGWVIDSGPTLVPNSVIIDQATMTRPYGYEDTSSMWTNSFGETQLDLKPVSTDITQYLTPGETPRGTYDKANNGEAAGWFWVDNYGYIPDSGGKGAYDRNTPDNRLYPSYWESFPITAKYTVESTYKWQLHRTVKHSDGSSTTYHTSYIYKYTQDGTASATLTIIGTDYYIIPTTAGWATKAWFGGPDQEPEGY